MALSNFQTPSKTMNCHMNQKDGPSDIEAIANSYKNNHVTKCEKCICYDALTSAPHGHDFNLKDILYSVAVNIPTLRINKVSSFSLALTINKEYQPPELYLANSSFLL